MNSINYHFLYRILVLLSLGCLSLQAELKLEDYPLEEQLVIGSVPAQLKAKRSHTYLSPYNGSVELLAPQMAGKADEGVLLAYLDRERMELESQLLDAEREQIEKQEIPEKQLSFFQTLRNLENRDAEISQQMAFIEEIEKNPELSEIFAKKNESFSSDKTEATGRLKTERQITQQVLHNMKQKEVRSLAEDLITLKLRKRELEQSLRMQEARIAMPFDGNYQILFPLEPGETVYKAMEGDPLVRVENLDSVYAVVEIHGVRWRTLPRARLSLRVPGMSGFGEEYWARFNQAVTSDTNQSGALLYFFEFSGTAAKRAAGIRGGAVSAEILLGFGGRSARIVPKLDLLKAYPEAFDQSWQVGLRTIFEDIKTIYIGRDAIAFVEDKG